jgi:hypothetical protein
MTGSSCLIILTPDFLPLGEVLLEDQACRQINFNRQGEALLGPQVSSWQTEGIPHMRPQAVRHQNGSADLWSSENHTLQSVDFVPALSAWLEDHGFHYLILPLGAMLAWSDIQGRDVGPQRKYEMAVMLRDLPIHKIVD